MAVAFGNALSGSNSPDVTGVSFSFTNSGNAICVIVEANWYNSGTAGTVTATYAGQSLTSDFFQDNLDYNYYRWTGLHKLNAASGANTLTISTGATVQDFIKVYVVSVSGASTTTLTGYNSVQGAMICDNATHTTSSLRVTSQVDDLVIGFACWNGGVSSTQSLNGGTVRTTPAGTPTAAFYSNSYAGASPSVSFTQTYYGDLTDDITAGYFLGGWSFPPAGAGPTPIAKLGGRYVSNQVQTTPGNATRVVANAYNGDGNDVGGGGVVDVYTGVL